jgi:hypothetical protein
MAKKMTELTMKIVSHIGALSYMNRDRGRSRVVSQLQCQKPFTAFNRNHGKTLKQAAA